MTGPIGAGRQPGQGLRSRPVSGYPAYNEADNLPTLFDRLHRVLADID
jgi:hypothetical protein